MEKFQRKPREFPKRTTGNTDADFEDETPGNEKRSTKKGERIRGNTCDVNPE